MLALPPPIYSVIARENLAFFAARQIDFMKPTLQSLRFCRRQRDNAATAASISASVLMPVEVAHVALFTQVRIVSHPPKGQPWVRFFRKNAIGGARSRAQRGASWRILLHA